MLITRLILLAALAFTLITQPDAGPSATSNDQFRPQLVGSRVAEPLPVGGIVFDSTRASANLELFVADTFTGRARRITSNSAYDSWGGRLSPDRRRVVFQRTPAGVRDSNYALASLWAVDVNGRNLTRLRDVGRDGWQLQGHPEWAPDGRSIVVFGGAAISPQIVLIDTKGAIVRKVTARGGTNLDPSVSPDGKTIVFIGCPVSTCYPQDYEVYTVPFAGGAVTRITYNDLRDHDPVYSPDGEKLAWLTQFSTAGPAGAWDIQVAAKDGSGARRLIGDDQITSRPEWTRDGSRLVFHRLVYGEAVGFTLYSARPDGTDLQPLRPGETALTEYPST